MPTYDYECESCGHRFEVFQSMSDDPVKSCPKCGKGVRRLIGGGLGVIFKGSGFYVTDNRRSGNGSGERHAPKNGSGGSNGNGEAKKSEKKEGGSATSDSSSKPKDSSVKESV